MTRFMTVIFLRSLQHSVIAVTNQGMTVIKLVNSTYKERQTDGTTPNDEVTEFIDLGCTVGGRKFLPLPLFDKKKSS